MNTYQKTLVKKLNISEDAAIELLSEAQFQLEQTCDNESEIDAITNDQILALALDMGQHN